MVLEQSGDVTNHAMPCTITARLAGAGSLFRELEAVLAAAPPAATAADFRRLILEDNAAAKGTATARMWAWRRLKLRYMLDRPASPVFQAFRAAWSASGPRDRGLLAGLMLAWNDRLVRELWLELVSRSLSSSGTVIDPDAVREAVDRRRRSANLNWSAKSVANIANHLLSALKDFGIVEGSRIRRTVRPHPRPAVTSFAATLARAEGLTDRQAITSDWFRLLGRDESGATDLLRTAAEHGVLRFRMQAEVVELEIPSVAAG